MHCTHKYSQHSSIVWPVRLNGWVFIYERSAYRFESYCSHYNFPCCKGQHPYPFWYAKAQSDVLGGWVGKNIFTMTFCVTKWFQRRSQSRRKNIKKCKKLQLIYVCFPFHHGSLVDRELLVLEGFLNSAFVISPQKKAPTSLFYSLQHVQNGREKNYLICVYSFSNHILTF